MKVNDLGVIQFRQKGEKNVGSSRPTVADKVEEEAGNDQQIMCAHCRQPVTTKESRLEVSGAHEHTFFNPAGIVFEIGCYSKAFGCLASGAPSTEFSWFKGFKWRFALCSGCFSHLGWRFESAGSNFYGLIFKKLIM